MAVSRYIGGEDRRKLALGALRHARFILGVDRLDYHNVNCLPTSGPFTRPPFAERCFEHEQAKCYDYFNRSANVRLSISSCLADRTTGRRLTACARRYGRRPPQTALKTAAAEWDAITSHFGHEAQKAADE